MGAVEVIVFTDAEEVTFAEDAEAAEMRNAQIEEDEAHDCLYSPNRFCEVNLYPHVWDEMQTLFVEWQDNFFTEVA